MISKLLVSLLALIIGIGMAGCVKVTKEDGKTKVRPGTIEVERHEVRDAPATQP